MELILCKPSEPRVKKLGRIIAATSVQKRCQLHSWLASTCTYVHSNGMTSYSCYGGAVVAMVVVR